MKSQPGCKLRLSDFRVLVLINQLSLPDGREKAGGCAHTLGNEPAYALSSLGVKALVLCLEATTNFELKMWKNPLSMKVSFVFPCSQS